MRSRFLLVPAALIAAASPAAHAETAADIQRAQQAIFPGATFTEHFIKLTLEQEDAVYKDTQVFPPTRFVNAWIVSTGGWFILDRVESRNAWVTYVVGIDAAGAVKQLEILEAIENYDQIKLPEWRAQFVGKMHHDYWGKVEVISGCTISSREVIAGVRRVLSTVSLVLQPELQK